MQARYELHRALDFGDDVALARWAREWGSSILEATGHEIATLTKEIDRLAEGLDDARDAVVDTHHVEAALTTVSQRLATVARALDEANVGADSILTPLTEARQAAVEAKKQLDNL